MNLTKGDLICLRELACEAAAAAAKVINGYRGAEVAVERKTGGNTLASQVVTEVDLRSQQVILEYLHDSIDRFDLAVLTEESADDGERLGKDHFWCIDPLDGTLPFTEGRFGYAVSIALVSRSGVPLIGVVVDPCSSNTYDAIVGYGARRNGGDWKLPNSGTELSLFADRSLVTHDLYPKIDARLQSLALKNNLDRVKRFEPRGAVMNAIGVYESVPACYIKAPKPVAGGGSIWDFAATVCIGSELGCSVTDFMGNALHLNNPDTTFMNEKGVFFSSGLDIARALA